MRHNKLPRAKPRPITPRRLAAAEKFLRKEREATPLFAEQIAAEQPTPEERISSFEDESVEHLRSRRLYEASVWKACRKALREAGEKGRAVAARWQSGIYPASACYLADLCHRSGIKIYPDRAKSSEEYSTATQPVTGEQA